MAFKELEVENSLPFLDVLVKRNDNDDIETSVYRKKTNTDIYMNWHSHAPTTWKIATLKSLIKRGFLISSKTETLNKELEHIKATFCDKNDYPKRLVDEIIKNERNLQEERNRTPPPPEEDIDEETPNAEEDKAVALSLSLPYAGMNGEKLVTKLKKYVLNTVNKNQKKISLNAIYRAKRLGTSFSVKDKIALKHQHNLVYHGECPNKKCSSNYTGETKCRFEKRTGHHSGKDKKSHIFQHSLATKHKRFDIHSFKIIGRGYRSNFARKISEALHIKSLKPDLNVQKESYRLALFN